MVKDVYEGRRRESVLALVQSMVVISPAVAPVLGAFMLPYTSWRGLFAALALIGVVSMAGTVTQSLRRLGVVLRNPGFTSLLVVHLRRRFRPLGTVVQRLLRPQRRRPDNGPAPLPPALPERWPP